MPRRRGEPRPAFVSELDPPLADALVRLIASLDDLLERKVIAPLVLEEICVRRTSNSVLRAPSIIDTTFTLFKTECPLRRGKITRSSSHFHDWT